VLFYFALHPSTRGRARTVHVVLAYGILFCIISFTRGRARTVQVVLAYGILDQVRRDIMQNKKPYARTTRSVRARPRVKGYHAKQNTKS
jgi:hypothetical protein